MAKVNVRAIVLCGMFSAIISIICPWSIPVFTIPITLSTFIISLAGYCLDGYWGVLSVFVYLILGVIGLPVFSNFNAGIGVLLGPTGGFLIAYPFLALACSVGANKTKSNKALCIAIGLVGVIILHIVGMWHFIKITKVGLSKTLVISMLPLFIKDCLSLVVAYFASIKIRKIISFRI